jgi:hypothetical protein
MEKFLNIFVTIILLSIIYMYFESRSYDVTYVKSNVDNREYLVRNLSDKQMAADLLAKIRTSLVTMIGFLRNNNVEFLANNYLPSYNVNQNNGQNNGQNNENNRSPSQEEVNKLQEDLTRLQQRFNPDNLSESTPDKKYTSYSVNKGEKIVFCLRSKDERETLVRENIMMFVALHELAHVMTKSVGHTEEFWNNFRFLLKVAINQGLYQNINYNDTPKDYCGTTITDTPLKEGV